MDPSQVDLALMQGNVPSSAPFDMGEASQHEGSAEASNSSDENSETVKAVALLEKLTAKPDKTKKPSKSKSVSGEVLPSDIIASAAHEIENLTSKGALVMANDLMDGTELGTFKLGGVLAQINTNKFFTEYGFASHKEFVEGSLSISYRVALYMQEIYEQVIHLGLTWDAIKHVGWTKLKTLLAPKANLITSENVDEWIKKAEGMTVLQLESAVKGAKANGGEAVEQDASKEVTVMSFKLHADQKDLIRTALEKAKEISGTSVDAVALECIASQFLGTPGFSKSDASKSDASKSDAPEQKVSIVVDGKPLPDVFTEVGYEVVLGAFEQAFPKIGLDVTIPD
jgi:hypothetical protein